ncbi:UNVERIFIED_CONTAM: hypothetical protein PYX00_002526 [Menopon gallinae]|uniref:SOCS box domain-containing protein n=1 Tax=Menopon gallinae TaxID=328185 RepID=A0AAW2IJ32_9NEOP
MHLHFERNSNAKCDCAILSLTWMGKVPDELPEDEGWKLNRTNYYQEGWLATGNVRGIVGVTFTTSHCKKTMEYPVRTNYNLRGHRSEVILVKWNEPYQKLASCDSSGIIFVWIKYEGRWSIELINDRNTPVTHFAWSHDGRMALICYQDGFVLVGSVAGQRYWSSMLNLDSTITCGIWTPDDLQVYFGTSHGGLVVMDVHGAMVAQVSLAQAPVTSMAWSCEKFKMEEGDENENSDNSNLVLAVCLSTGHIFLMKSYDDVTPIQFSTGLGGPLCMEWSNSRQLLAVAGVANHTDNNDYVNMLKCYTDTGELLYSTYIPYSQSPVTALTWGHNDKRLFIATGGVIHIAWVSRRVASLQLLSRLKVASALPLGESSVQSLPLPPRIKHLISNLFAQTIRCCVPQSRGLREFVSRAPVNGTRLHCTMIRHDDEHLSSGACYTLYLEYLGGLVPLLKGKRTSKIRPEFVIFDPQVDGNHAEITYSKIQANGSDTSDTEKEDGCGGSPRAQRRRRRRRKSPADHEDDLTYIDTLPEDARLVEVTSNIWGTKFKIHGLADCVPANLGQVTYKTSLLHLQPRQMSLVMTELSNDVLHSPDPNFNPKVFSEDEEDDRNSTPDRNYSLHPPGGNGVGGSGGGAVPIAPMTPKRDGNRTRPINLTDGYGNHFVHLPRFIYTKPSAQRERVEIRKAVLENSILLRNPQLNSCRDSGRSSAEQSEDENNLSEAGCSNNSIVLTTRAQINAQCEKRNVQIENEPNASPKNQPSVISIDTNSSNTYQGDNDKEVKETTELLSPSGKPESIEDENSYVDFNLTDVISFCENFKLNENQPKPHHMKRQERSETSFLNHHVVQPQKSRDEETAISPTKSDFPGSPQSARTEKKNALQKPSEKMNAESIQFIDEDSDNQIDRMSRSCSVGFLDDVDTDCVAPCDSPIRISKKYPKRLFLVGGPSKKDHNFDHLPKSKSNLITCGKSRSLDSSDLFSSKGEISKKPEAQLQLPKQNKTEATAPKQEMEIKKTSVIDTRTPKNNESKEDIITMENIGGSNLCIAESSIEPLPPPSPRLPRSQPVTPALSKKKRNQSASPIRKHILNSPLLRRKRAKSKAESSDDEVNFSGDEAFTSSSHFKDLESFQKAQLRQKLKRGKVSDGNATPKVRELVMHNKAPMWNENSQVYQLDFGGRVTQESAKNFQIEFKGKQVMQFGRIDGNAYTLDFQYPFSVLQAFAVALANVTQRLK